MKYTFSGHESFPCKTLWLKKGYDYVQMQQSFNAPEAVVKLGVGKNMVNAIRYWMKAFGLIQDDKLTPIADYLFDDTIGKDKYTEDLGTLWLLHYLLVSKCEATLYNIFFVRFQRERKSFERQNIVRFINRIMIEEGKQSLFNENTVKKDIGVLLQNYVLPIKSDTPEDFSSLLIDLELIRTSDGKTYNFNEEGKRDVPSLIFLYAILDEADNDANVSYDILKKIGLTFCMNDIEVIEMCESLQELFPSGIRYSDTAGVKQLQFMKVFDKKKVLDYYYDGQ